MTCTTCEQIKENRIRLVTSTGVLTCPSCGAKHDRSASTNPEVRNTSLHRMGKILTAQEEQIVDRMFPYARSHKRRY